MILPVTFFPPRYPHCFAICDRPVEDEYSPSPIYAAAICLINRDGKCVVSIGEITRDPDNDADEKAHRYIGYIDMHGPFNPLAIAKLLTLFSYLSLEMRHQHTFMDALRELAEATCTPRSHVASLITGLLGESGELENIVENGTINNIDYIVTSMLASGIPFQAYVLEDAVRLGAIRRTRLLAALGMLTIKEMQEVNAQVEFEGGLVEKIAAQYADTRLLRSLMDQKTAANLIPHTI
ncbi:MAG TPA: hypothetical protein VLG38_06855, partial [Gammaproteobacteria bacterium]|nr:hypothetical protein [Gammaproteobacteria bacterium]